MLAGELRRVGETDVRTFELATTPLAYCQGEFDCWVKTPASAALTTPRPPSFARFTTPTVS